MSVLDELEQAVRQVAERVGPSVVGIGRGRGRGSGVVLADGLVATNAHNIRDEETTVVFGGDRSAVGRVAGVDVDADLAVLRIDTGGAPAIAWAEGAESRVGTAVFALANPGGQLRVTFGLVSAVGRAFRGPGAAGSPAASSTPLPCPGAPRAGRWSTPPGGCSASTPTGWATASTWPCRPTPSCASGWTPSAVARRRPAPGSASASPRPGSPGSCAARSASPSAT